MSDRFESLQHWLRETLETNNFILKPASEDASFRHYYRLTTNKSTLIVMDAPPHQEDSKSFVRVNSI